MKNTILMCAFMGTLFLTWGLFATIGWALSKDICLRECFSHGGTLLMMFIFGWIPSIIVCGDLCDKLKKR